LKKHPKVTVALLLFLVSAAVYFRAAYFPFTLIDDPDYVSNNFRVASGLSFNSLQWAFTTFHAGNWHPLTWLSLMADSQLFGTAPLGFHLVNVLLHSVNAALLLLLFTSMTGALWRSAFVAACFALHPLHVESVVWIAERKDVLSMFFFLLTLTCYASYVQKAKLSRYFYALAAFALGLMAKPMLVSLPFVLVLLDLWPLGRFSLAAPVMPESRLQEREIGKGNRVTRLLLEKVPFLVLSGISAVLTWRAHGAYIATAADLPLALRVNNALWTAVLYLKKTLLPFDLALFYPLTPVPLWKAGCAALLLGGICWIVLKQFKRFPYLAVGWFWYLVTLAPVLGLVQVGNQAMADRYCYLPHLGLFVMLSWGGAELGARRPQFRKALALSAAAMILLMSVATEIQLGYWRDNVTLSRHALDVTGDNYFAQMNLGLAYEKLGQRGLAIRHFEEALRINPADSQSLFNLGLSLANAGRLAESLGYFEKALRITPQFANMHYCLGVTLGRLGKTKEAIGEYRRALAIEPDHVRCLNNIGTALAQQGNYPEAMAHFARILQLVPDDRKAGLNLQLAGQLLNQGRGK